MLLRALLVEDEDDHAEREASALRRGFGPSVDLVYERARTLGETEAALAAGRFDLAVVDYHLEVPGAGESAAMATLSAGVPFVVISHRLSGYAFRGVPILPKEPDFGPLAEWAKLWLRLREEDQTCE